MKKLIVILALSTGIVACSQAKSDAQAPKTPDKVTETLAKQKPASPVAEMQITHVNAGEAAKLLSEQKDISVIDVRTPAEYASGHIDGAINIDYKSADFATKLAQLDKTKPYLIHCRSGGRSTRSLSIFKENGFKHIYHMDGGILGWQKTNLPLVK